jgi:uncharacterized protein
VSVPTAPAPWESLVGFGQALRRAGVPAQADRVRAMAEALTRLPTLSRSGIYWAGRLTCCSRAEDIPVYDRVFEAWFTTGRGDVLSSTRVEVERPVGEVDDDTAGVGSGDDEQVMVTAAASTREVLRHRDVARLDPQERAEVNRLIAAIGVDGPHRRTRRTKRRRTGLLDRRATTAAMLRAGGEPARLRHRRRTLTPRRVVVLLDVSGSMRTYGEAYLRFAHAMARVRRRTEVFTMGTRLTRVTAAIRQSDPERALAALAEAVPDWSGGTRLGDSVREFLQTWGRRGLSRGCVVVIASDGWERGDATLLREQMARLHRQAHRVIWVNPQRGKDGYAPLTSGMQAALPSVDAFLAGHSVATLERLADEVAADRPRRRTLSRV